MLLPQTYRAQALCGGHRQMDRQPRTLPWVVEEVPGAGGPGRRQPPAPQAHQGGVGGVEGRGREPPAAQAESQVGPSLGCAHPTGPRRWTEDQLGDQTPGLSPTWASEDGAAHRPGPARPPHTCGGAGQGGRGGEGSHPPTRNQGCTGHPLWLPRQVAWPAGLTLSSESGPRADGDWNEPRGRAGLLQGPPGSSRQART